MSAKVKIRWTCPCGHENRWRWTRDNCYDIDITAMICDVCNKEYRCEVRKVVYRVTGVNLR